MRTHYRYNYKYKRYTCPYCKKSVADNWWVRHLEHYHWKEFQEALKKRLPAEISEQQTPPAA